MQVLDIQPEEPGLATTTASETLRVRLSRVLPALLRLAVAVVWGLPNSRQARDAAAAFAEAHHQTLLRLLREAGSPAIRQARALAVLLAGLVADFRQREPSAACRGWCAGETELEAAELAVQLLSK